MTLVSLSLILSLTLYEFVDYRKVHMVKPLFSVFDPFRGKD